MVCVFEMVYLNRWGALAGRFGGGGLREAGLCPHLMSTLPTTGLEAAFQGAGRLVCGPVAIHKVWRGRCVGLEGVERTV